jgi:Tol biopolymer transport system component
LDGSDPRGLVNGYYPALSPDGTHIAFMSQNVSLNILDLNNGQTILLENGTNPVWSPDGLRILFYNPPDGLYLAKTDGTGMQKIETGSPRVNPIGWLPDNQTIVFGAQVGDIYNLYEHVFKTYNLQTGETKSLFPITIKTPSGAISPDGQWIAFNARLFGANLDGAVFISRLDGSERKLVVANLDNSLAFHPVWSPDGQWLIVSVVEPYKPTSPVLVNPFTCQLIPLAEVKGEIQQWIP